MSMFDIPVLRAAVLCAVFAASAQAAPEARWSVGVGVGNASIDAPGYTGEGSASLTNLEFGWQATDALRVFGGFNQTDAPSGLGICPGPCPTAGAVELGTQDLHFGLEASVPLGGAWSGLARLSFLQVESTMCCASTKEHGVAVGLGVEYEINQAWSARLVAQTYDVYGADYLTTELGVRYHFDGAALAAKDGDARDRWNLALSLDSNSYDGPSGTFMGETYNFSGKSQGFRLEAAFRVFGPLWIEAGYRDFGELEGSYVACDAFPIPTDCDSGGYRFEGTAKSFALRAEWEFGQAWGAFLRYGTLAVDGETTSDPSTYFPGGTTPTSDSGRFYGAGAVYRFADRYAATLAYETPKDLESLVSEPESTATLGLRVSF